MADDQSYTASNGLVHMADEKMSGPHAGQTVRTAGVPLDKARAAMVMVHGRGATAESILTLVDALNDHGFAFLAPQASGNTWYPNSFLAPIPSNEPGISSGLRAIHEVLTRIADADIPPQRTILLGFSQGACLSLEYAARHAQRYGGVACLSGGLIGPADTPRDYDGSFDDTPVFFGCSDVDSHIPAARVVESASVFRSMGARVTMKLYPGMGHLVNEDEIAQVDAMMEEIASRSQ